MLKGTLKLCFMRLAHLYVQVLTTLLRSSRSSIWNKDRSQVRVRGWKEEAQHKGKQYQANNTTKRGVKVTMGLYTWRGNSPPRHHRVHSDMLRLSLLPSM